MKDFHIKRNCYITVPFLLVLFYQCLRCPPVLYHILDKIYNLYQFWQNILNIVFYYLILNTHLESLLFDLLKYLFWCILLLNHFLCLYLLLINVFHKFLLLPANSKTCSLLIFSSSAIFSMPIPS